MSNFRLVSSYQPAGDQRQAIERLVTSLEENQRHQTLLGVTGSGKTFTIANVIDQVQRPTLVIAPNKTLAAQLTTEFRTFFPENAVEYFVSYYDYYQPEAYVPGTDTYIEKDADINEEIDRLRHAATAALLSRKDVIVVASVSCIYGLGSPTDYQEQNLILTIGLSINRADLISHLVDMHYERNEVLKRGAFRVHGPTIELMPADRESVIEIELDGSSIAKITERDLLDRREPRQFQSMTIFPAKHFVVSKQRMETAFAAIESELEERLKFFEREGKLLEAERLERRTRYDLELLREIGYCSGVENYSRYLTGRAPGEPPYTLIDFFSDDFLVVIDESHVTVPQIGGMYAGDKSRKQTLIDYGFRLPSALDNRPLRFEEFMAKMKNLIYVSATPGSYELTNSTTVAEQIVRPTGLIDPEIVIRPAKQQVLDLLAEIELVVARHERVLVTTLTKKQAEQLTTFLSEKNLKAGFLHSEVDTLERIGVLQELRRGDIDILVGVNLLREGLDLPEVALVAILDADKEGFLRSETSLIQTMGRAARNIRGRVLLYADRVTGSMKRAIDEADRRRTIQLTYNQEHHVTPQTIEKAVNAIVDYEFRPAKPAQEFRELVELRDLPRLIRDKEQVMKKLSKDLKFEEAVLVRDEIIELKKLLKQS